MQVMGGEFGCGESVWQCNESGWKYEKCGESGGDARNQGGTLSIAVKIIWNSNGNDKLKDWREVKIISLVSRISHSAFLVNLGYI